MNRRVLYCSFVLFVVIGAGFAWYATESSSYVELRGKQYSVEVMRTDVEHQQGLSGREKLNEDQAMLFVFDSLGQRCFWMKDMRFSIDMVWLDADKRVVHIERNVSPKTYPKSFCPSVPAQYVVETNANATKGLKVGDHVSF